MEQLLEFTNNHLILTGGLVLSLFYLLFTEFSLQSMAGVDLSVPEAITRINQDAVVVDIRPAEQFAKGHITGARNLTADQLTENDDRLSDIAGKEVILTCQTGMQCSRVVSSLRKKGYDQVYSLKGGIDAWTQEKLPLVDTGKRRGKRKDKRKK